MYPTEILLTNYDDINYIVRYTCQNNDFDNFCKRRHRSIVEPNICTGMLMVFYIFVCFFANFLLFFIRISVFLSFAFILYFFFMKYQIFETVNQPETGIGDQKLSAELYEHDCFRNPWRFRSSLSLKSNFWLNRSFTQPYDPYCWLSKNYFDGRNLIG